MKNKKVSIIAPCFNEEKNIDIFYDNILAVFSNLQDYTYELIFVDDASSDETVNQIKKIINNDKKVKLVVNARNYGVYKNSFNGIQYATGEVLVPMLPVDLQDPPELIREFLKKWEIGDKIIIGTRKDREEFFLKRFIRSVYYKIAKKFSDFNLIEYGGEFGLLDKSIYKQLLDFNDYYPYTRGLIASLSNDISTVPYVWKKRKQGKSNYSLFNYYDHAINGIVSTSRNILRRFIFIGLMSSVVLFLAISYQIFSFLFYDRTLIPPGTLTILIVLSFISVFLLISLSLISEYIVAIHSQVRNNIGVVEKEIVNISN
tara:strand:- start:4859 stop:5806 length:948 start_codon:yes stop_codon:yes gene_type:complete